MFLVHCDNHGGEVLLPYGRVRLVNTDDGIAVFFRCTCGHEGVERTGIRPHAAA